MNLSDENRGKIVSRPSWVAVLLSLCLLALLIWQRVQLSEQIPVLRCIQVYVKAKHFWDAVHSGQDFSAFGLAPTFRPFGTVLMSYPFGFSSDPRPFYFRSVVLGIIVFVAAIRLVTFSDGKSAASIIWGSLVAVGGSALPMFYHFEPADHYPPHPAFWGLVDCFFAGLAALAAAAVVRAVSLQSMAWTAVAMFSTRQAIRYIFNFQECLYAIPMIHANVWLDVAVRIRKVEQTLARATARPEGTSP
jgi:hypothetical protein